MSVLRREWHGVRRTDEFTLVPLGDVHLGNAASDERLFRAVVQRIADDEKTVWIGLGDYCEFINRSDPRFSVESLADWIRIPHLADLAKAQAERFLEIVRPIAGKCLALLEGNHERQILRHYERSIYSEIVSGVKQMGGFPAEHRLALGYCGWLVLVFRRLEGDKAASYGGTTTLKVYAHHGFVGGKLAGAKALNLQRWLWSHEADLVIFGHSHNRMVQVEAVEAVAGSRIVQKHRIGCCAGSFMTGADYAQEKGYFPTPVGHVEVVLKPRAKQRNDRIRIIQGM